MTDKETLFIIKRMTNNRLSPEEVAELCQVTRQTIYNWLYRGKIPYASLGKHYRIRIRREDIPDFLIEKENGEVVSQEGGLVGGRK